MFGIELSERGLDTIPKLAPNLLVCLGTGLLLFRLYFVDVIRLYLLLASFKFLLYIYRLLRLELLSRLLLELDCLRLLLRLAVTLHVLY